MLGTYQYSHTTTPQPFYGPGSGTTQVIRCEKRILDFMVQGKINRGRHTDHLAGRHSIRLTSANLHHPPYFFTGRMPFLPPNQQRQSTDSNTYQDSIRTKDHPSQYRPINCSQQCNNNANRMYLFFHLFSKASFSCFRFSSEFLSLNALLLLFKLSRFQLQCVH